MDVARARTVLQAIYRETREENLTFMAGSIAYHAFVSLLPLVVLLVIALDSFGQETLVEGVFALTEAVLTDGGRDILDESLGTGTRVSGVSILGGAVLVWATLRIFRGLDQAFSDIYETERRNSLPDQVGDGILVLVVVVLAVVAVATVRDRLVFEGPAGTVLQTAFVVAALTLVFLPMYYVFPDEGDMRVVEVLPGTALAAVGVTALESLFRVYVEFSSTTDYGVLGGVVLLLTWLYFNGLVILLGAVVNAVLTNRTENFDIDPVVGSFRPAAEEGADLAGRLTDLGERIRAGDSVTVSVGVDRVTLPPPAAVSVESDDGDGPVLTIRWDGAGPGSGTGEGGDPDRTVDGDPDPGTGGDGEVEAGPTGETAERD